MGEKIEQLYKWYPIIDEGEYWLDSDIGEDTSDIRTIVAKDNHLFHYHDCPLGWGTMAKDGGWRYMRISIDYEN